MDNSEFRTIQSTGYNELISKLTEGQKVEHSSVMTAAGDDAAVIEEQDKSLFLISSEIFTEGVNFDLTYSPLQHLGYKIVSSAVSDIYAMNGIPQNGLLNIAIPNKISAGILKKLYRGIFEAGKIYDLQIVGGDLNASRATMNISITVTGKTNEKNITYRSVAREGDAICVTGDLGAATAGLRILMREKQIWKDLDDKQSNFQPDLDDYEYVVKRQLLPSARNDIISSFHEHNIIPHAMIDITKGTINEFKELAIASGVGGRIYQSALPIAVETRAVADEMSEPVDQYACYGGEDLELLFTIAQTEIDTVTEKFDKFNVIGEILPSREGLSMKTNSGELIQLTEND
jgi:thiamine-monophosphate kinase